MIQVYTPKLGRLPQNPSGVDQVQRLLGEQEEVQSGQQELVK